MGSAPASFDLALPALVSRCSTLRLRGNCPQNGDGWRFAAYHASQPRVIVQQ